MDCPGRPRPTITAAQPVVASTVWARAREVMSPEATTGTSTSSTSSAVSEWSASPVYICRAERGWSVSEAAPASTRRGPRLEAGARAVLEAAAHLDGHRQVDGVGDRRDDPRGAAGVLEQRGARTGLRHLADRAAEVDVDDVGARVGDHPGRLGHHGRLGAEDLHGERMLVRRDAQVSECPLVLVVQAGAADHLRADQSGAEAAALAPERLHADAGHRREHETGRNLHRPDPPGGAEIDVHARHDSRV